MSIGAYLSTREGTTKKVGAYSVAIATFCAFIFFGFLPLFPYIFSFGSFTLSGIITGVAFICIGYLKSIMNHSSPPLAILQTVLLGGIAASVAYYAGLFLRSL